MVLADESFPHVRGQMVPAVRQIWHHVQHAPLNADSMAQDLIEDAGLTYVPGRRVPDGFGIDD